jgi:hypothetical protein
MNFDKYAVDLRNSFLGALGVLGGSNKAISLQLCSR